MAKQAKKVRVLILIAGLSIGQQGGGAERFGIELARHLPPAECEPIICAFWRRNLPTEARWADVLAASGIEMFYAVTRGRQFTPWSYVNGLQTIRTHLHGRPPDVIHSQFQLGTVAALGLRRAGGARVSLRTAHGTVEHEWENTWSGRVCRGLFTRWLFPIGLDAEVGVSRAIVANMDRRPGARYGRKPMRLIYNGIPAGPLPETDDRETARRTLGLPLDALVIGSVGRLSEQKGYSYLLRALPIVLTRWPEARVVLIGDGELRGRLEAEAADLGIAHALTFVGARHDAGALYPAMDLFVLPSLWEGLPTVVLESMAVGIAVAATDIPGTQDLVQEGATGWLAPPADPAGLAHAILRALDDPTQRADVARRAAEQVVSLYTMDAIARQYANLYRQLLHDSGDVPD